MLFVSILVLHLHIIRARWGPLYKTSAFLFEAMFAQLTRAYVPGSHNTLSQMMEKIYTRLLSSHACRKQIYIGPEETDHIDDSLFYTWTKEAGHKFYKAISVFHPEHGVAARRIVHVEEEETNLAWKEVGLYYFMTESDQIVQIPADRVKGKAIRVDKYIMSVSNGLLRESGRSRKVDLEERQYFS